MLGHMADSQHHSHQITMTDQDITALAGMLCKSDIFERMATWVHSAQKCAPKLPSDFKNLHTKIVTGVWFFSVLSSALAICAIMLVHDHNFLCIADLHSLPHSCLLFSCLEAARRRGRQFKHQYSSHRAWVPKSQGPFQARDGWAPAPVVALPAAVALYAGHSKL